MRMFACVIGACTAEFARTRTRIPAHGHAHTHAHWHWQFVRWTEHSRGGYQRGRQVGDVVLHHGLPRSRGITSAPARSW